MTPETIHNRRWAVAGSAIAIACAFSGCSNGTSTAGVYAASGGASTGGGPTSTGGGVASTGAAPGSGRAGGASGGGGNDAGIIALAMVETPLASDDDSAPNHDPNLLNAWGLAINPAAPGGPFFWVSANHSGLATVYDRTGKIVPLTVNVSPGDGGAATGAPTGQVFNTTTAFLGDKFIFDGEDGKVSGWQAGASAVVRADESPNGAVYKGLAMVGSSLWAANFHAGRIDVFDESYRKTSDSPAMPHLPARYAPFNVATTGGKIYVAYAMQDADAEDDVPGVSHGYVDAFDQAGQFEKRLISGGVLDSPWAMAKAPGTLDGFADMLLVGNFGDGTIHAFDPESGALVGTVTNTAGAPLRIPGLWDLKFGPTTGIADLGNTLFFTAGPGGEAHGLFGKLELAR